MTHFGAILEAAAAPAGFFEQYGTTILMIVVMVGFFYFMFRNDSKKKKQQKEMRENIKPGDDITTVGGMIGKVVDVDDDGITFENGEDRVRIKIIREAIQTVGRIREQTK